MTRSEVWEETHLLPLRLKFQCDADGSVVAQLPGYGFPILTVTGSSHPQALSAMREQMTAMMGAPAATPARLIAPSTGGAETADDDRLTGDYLFDAILPSAPAQAVETAGVRDVLAERERQKTVEGWTPEHDDEHDEGEMAMAAACYAAHSSTWQAIEHGLDSRSGIFKKHVAAQEFVGRMWPWGRNWWKPKDPRRNLIRAAALIVAEIERLDRRAALQSPAASPASKEDGSHE